MTGNNHSRARNPRAAVNSERHDLGEQKIVTVQPVPDEPVASSAIGKGKKRHDLTQALRARRYRLRKGGATVPRLKPGPKPERPGI